MDHSQLIESLNFRHACKRFESAKKIPKEELSFILEAGRLSPSSFGMEPWHFIVIQDQALKERLRPACWNQEQIAGCSDLVVITARVSDPARRDYFESMFARREMAPQMLERYLEIYQNYIDNLPSLYDWCAKQCYIAAGNMMSYAAMIEIDSCPIEGFEKEKVETILELDSTQEEVVLLIALGYRIDPQSKKLRLPFEQIVSFR
jgi:nitroreductase